MTAIAPNNGTPAGGTSVTVTGTSFLPGATLSLGGTPATGLTVVSATSITATTPAHAAGAVNVAVTNPDGQTGTLANGYTYSSTTPNLGLGVVGGDSSSATVTAGQSASYTLSIGGDGMGGTAMLSCTGAPAGANCTVPASQAFNSTTPTTFNVGVTTTARTAGGAPSSRLRACGLAIGLHDARHGRSSPSTYVQKIIAPMSPALAVNAGALRSFLRWRRQYHQPAAGLERHPSRKLYFEREGDFGYDNPDHRSYLDREIGARGFRRRQESQEPARRLSAAISVPFLLIVGRPFPRGNQASKSTRATQATHAPQ